ncbi:cytochrome P450, partial [Mycena pura]
YLLILFLGAVLIAVPLYRLSPLHRLHGVPGPKLNKITELTMLYYAVLGLRHNKLRALHDRYGRVVQIGPNTLSFISPTAISSIYGSANAPDKSTAYDMQHLKGDGLFFLKDKASHSRRRRIWNRSFSEEALLGYQDPLVREIEHLFDLLLKKTSNNGKVDLVKILPQYSYDSMVGFQTSLLDSDDPANIAAEGTKFFRLSELFTHIQPLFHCLMLIPGISRFMPFEKLSILAAERRLKNGATFRDGISYWVRIDVDFTINKLTLYVQFDGADTLGSTTTMMFYFLITNPKWITVLREELRDVFDEQGRSQQLNSLDQIPILEAFVQETLRLGTLLPGLPRVVPNGGMIIDGHHIPSGTVVNVPVWAYHVDPDYFPNPRAFDPNRWIEHGNFSMKVHSMAFGVGMYNCVGSKLALTQLRILLAMAVHRLEFTPEPGFDSEKFWNGMRNTRTADFMEPLWVRVTHRNPSD